MMPELRDKGLSLRFPRFIRIREDKSVEMASTPALLVRLWLSQEHKGQSAAMGGIDEGELIDYVEEEIEDEYESSEHIEALFDN
jgi:DNA ligase-1